MARRARTALAALSLLLVSLMGTEARAQACNTTGTNQTCTNSVSLSGGAVGISDNGILTITNTASGVVFGAPSVGMGSGIGAYAVDATNSGSIIGTGAAASFGTGRGSDGNGFIVNNSANVTNSGSIVGIGGAGGNFSGNGGVGSGMLATTANVTNSGSIVGIGGAATSGSFGGSGIGINTDYGTIFNCGTISGIAGVAGGNGYGIFASNNVNVTNCGTISGATAALQFNGNSDTLTLLPGSRIVGAINLGTGDTINVNAGNQNLSFNSLSSATINGTMPYVVSGNRIVSVDPTSFAAAGTALNDFARNVSAIVPDFSGVSVPGSGVSAFAAPDNASVVPDAFAALPGLSAYAASDRIAFKAPTAVYTDGITVWGRGFGGQNTQPANATTLRNTTTWYGGAMGVDRLVQPDLRLGVFVGAGSTHNSIDLNAGSTDTDLGFAGAYARYMIGTSFLYAAVQGGGLSSATVRNVNNNLVPNGLETATGAYRGWYLSPEATIGRNIALGSLGTNAAYTLTPSLQVRYLYGAFGGYTETGTTAPLTVGDSYVSTFEERGQIKLTRTDMLASGSLTTSLYGGGIGDERASGSVVNATLLAQPLAFTAAGANVWGGFGGLAAEWHTRNVSLFLAGEYLAWQNAGSVLSGRGGIRITF